MKLHANARLSLIRRQEMVMRVKQDGLSFAEAAKAAGVSANTCAKWVRRFELEGQAGLLDRSSAPNRVANKTPESRVAVIAALRRLRMTGAEIAETLQMPETTVSGLLTAIGMGRLGRLGQEPAQRYEKARPGEMIHIDVKKLGRISRPGHAVLGGQPARAKKGYHRKRSNPGWEFVHIAIDDATRLAYVEVLADEKATTAIGFLRRAVEWFGRYGIHVEQLLTDNGSAYRSKVHAIACRALGIKHRRTRPYRPQTNGKAERFIRTMLGGWAYGAIYRDSAERTAALDGWLWHYNHRRRHGALSRQTPVQRLNNLLGSYN